MIPASTSTIRPPVSKSLRRSPAATRTLSNRLVACIRDRYGRITGLPFHDSITPDMTQYHAFNEIDPATTAAIIEAGFLYKDYDILTSHPDVIADGIVAGIQCFVNNENIAPQPTIAP